MYVRKKSTFFSFLFFRNTVAFRENMKTTVVSMFGH